MTEYRYSDEERAAIYRAIYERRDMRHFLPDPIDPEQLRRLLEAAHHAPSVGYMQPWRFIRITCPELVQQIHALVEQERLRTARALDEREDEFMKLKVEGILECPVVLVAALCEGRDKAVFGRRTMPDMDLASLACAIQNLWLAARAEGLGMGWVSLFEPEDLKQLLAMPKDSRPAAILCLGHVPRFYDKPLLEQERWADRRNLDQLIFENRWDTLCG
ncbi:MAG: 5,6-dimethylbenzimidazole synthase [Gammaproteobacteria bacterium]